MCTITYIEPDLQTATEDIVVYKTVINPVYNFRTWLAKLLRRERILLSCESRCYGFIYHVGEVYETKLSPFAFSFSRYFSRNGFYSWKDKPVSRLDTIVKCIIPKGAKYYLSEDMVTGGYVYTSDKIKIISQV